MSTVQDRERLMRAWRTHEYGQPTEVLRLDTVPIPAPEAGELLVRVQASSVNPVDAFIVAGYLKRSCDYRSVLGEIIRKHLGATQGQLNRIIPGYDDDAHANQKEYLLSGGVSEVDNVQIRGEVGIL